MKKTRHYGILESHEHIKWWNMPPALKISRFISNGSAQSGKLIKVCRESSHSTGRLLHAGWKARICPLSLPCLEWACSYTSVTEVAISFWANHLTPEGMHYAMHSATEGRSITGARTCAVYVWSCRQSLCVVAKPLTDMTYISQIYRYSQLQGCCNSPYFSVFSQKGRK